MGYLGAVGVDEFGRWEIIEELGNPWYNISVYRIGKGNGGLIQGGPVGHSWILSGAGIEDMPEGYAFSARAKLKDLVKYKDFGQFADSDFIQIGSMLNGRPAGGVVEILEWEIIDPAAPIDDENGVPFTTPVVSTLTQWADHPELVLYPGQVEDTSDPTERAKWEKIWGAGQMPPQERTPTPPGEAGTDTPPAGATPPTPSPGISPILAAALAAGVALLLRR